MNQTEQRNDPAFEIDSINPSTGDVVVIIKKGIVGAMSNQLKNTDEKRKGSSILRKLGYVLSECGDVLYGRDVSETSLDPKLMVDTDGEV